MTAVVRHPTGADHARVDAVLNDWWGGFVSSARPDEAYIHFVGVRPDRRGEGHARALYERFFALAGERGCRRVGCITAPINEGSIAFHRSMGFNVVPGDADVGGTSVHMSYDGPGEDRIVFRRALL